MANLPVALGRLGGQYARHTQATKNFPVVYRAFATTAFTIKPVQPSVSEQTLFVVGLNQGKFFGQDGAEEGLKLLERISEHDSQYTLLFGLSQKDLDYLEDEHEVEGGRLTPSRQLAHKLHGEFVPMMQAAKIDKRSRIALSRPLKTTQGHTAWRLWKNPREAVRLYRLYWHRNTYNDVAKYKFWSEKLPSASHVFFAETAEVIVIRTLEQIIADRKKGIASSIVLTLRNEHFPVVAERLKHYLAEDAAWSLDDPNTPQKLQMHAANLIKDVPDVTCLLVLFYLGVPLAALHQMAFLCAYLSTFGVLQGVSSQDLNFVAGNRD
jgi:hypothetical protein